jgi:cell shape-determining protein MreC
MSGVRFNQVFIAFVLLSGICSFAVPERLASAVRGNIDGLFAPVSVPVRKVAGTLSGRLRPEPQPNLPEVDLNGAPAPLREEVLHLRAVVTNLSAQLAESDEVKASRALWGNVSDYCAPFKVMGGETGEGLRQVLTIRSSGGDGLVAGMPVIYRDSIMGKITSVGISSAQVQLVSDPKFRVTARIGRFRYDADGLPEFVSLETRQPLLQGKGSGDSLMTIANLSTDEVQKAGIRQGDWVVLDEKDSDQWPPALRCFLLGQIDHVGEQLKAKGWADLTVRPWRDPQKLREVMVVTGKPPANAPPAVRLAAATPAAPPAPAQATPRGSTAQRTKTTPRGRG